MLLSTKEEQAVGIGRVPKVSKAKLAALDLKDKTIFLSNKHIDPGFVAKNILRSQVSAKKVSEKQVFEFRVEVKEFLTQVMQKIIDKSPLKFGLARNLGWLVPSAICDKARKCSNESMFRNSLQLLSSAKRVSVGECEEAVNEYRIFVGEVQQQEDKLAEFVKFTCEEGRLDEFWSDQLSTSPHKKLWTVVKTLLVLSHGQATVERGFSINKELMDTNTASQTLVALRSITDHVKHVGGIKNVVVTKKLLFAAASPRQKYQHYLDDQKRAEEEQKRGKKRKAEMDEVEGLKKKRKITEQNLKALVEGADSYAQKAEDKADMRLLAKSNAMRKSAKEKEEELKRIHEEIQEKLSELAAD